MRCRVETSRGKSRQVKSSSSELSGASDLVLAAAPLIHFIIWMSLSDGYLHVRPVSGCSDCYCRSSCGAQRVAPSRVATAAQRNTAKHSATQRSAAHLPRCFIAIFICHCPLAIGAVVFPSTCLLAGTCLI